MLQRGTLERTSLPAIIRPLVRHRRTGVLRLSLHRTLKTVYIDEGRLIFATSNDPDDRLGEILLRKGTITYRTLEDSARALRQGKRQGTILVENGAIRARDLIEGVSDQVRGIICSLVSWETGAYEFTEGPLPSREVIVLRISTADLLMDGIRRVERWSRIRSAVGDLAQEYALAPNAAALMSGVSLDKDELAVVASIDGPTTVEEICRSARQTDFWICRTLWGLWAVGILDRRPQDADDASLPKDETAPHIEGPRGFAIGREIERLNELHRLLFELVRYELREGARLFWERAFANISAEMPALFDGVAIDTSGELDPIALRHNILNAEIAGYLHGFDRLLQIEIDLAREMLGERKAAIILDGVMALKEQQLRTRPRADQKS
jgi:hypothetical protein